MTDREVLDMPIKRFWLMNTSVDRIAAQRDLRSLTLHNAAQNGEAATEHRGHLNSEIGLVVIAKPERDKNAVNDLKDLMFAT